MAKVRWTVDEAKAAWKCSRSLIYKYIKQERVKFEKAGRDFFILDDEKPEKEKLTEEQRAAWPKGQPVVKRMVVKRERVSKAR